MFSKTGVIFFTILDVTAIGLQLIIFSGLLDKKYSTNYCLVITAIIWKYPSRKTCFSIRDVLLHYL